MIRLPVVVHSDAFLGAPEPKLPLTELNHICVALSFGPGAAKFLKLMMLMSSFPDNAALSYVGVYQAEWSHEGSDWFVYLTNTGFTPLEIRRSSKDKSLLDDEDGQRWLALAAAKVRRLHEILASLEAGE